MANRAALLIHCSKSEARTIREQAQSERRTISGYLLNVLMTAIKLDENYARMRALGVSEVPYAHLLEHYGLNLMPTGKGPGPRTSILLWCAKPEARRIRLAAKRREITITGFIVHTLRCTWTAAAERKATIPHTVWLTAQSKGAAVMRTSRRGQSRREPPARRPRK